MATSIASQLQALKSVVNADSEPLKKPFVRPSILYNPKDAADIDLDTIFSLALSGLEVLIKRDERFSAFKRDLFNHKSKELDRELVGVEDNKRINSSINSYLKLLSGYFELLAAQKTLEYLIRRYKVHVYNSEELILCTLPYHDTYEFVRVVQLIDPGNSRWKFLDAVKASGAPPPRKVIVQQCIRDPGVLKVICDFAIPVKKKVQLLKAVNGFCTAVIVEVLGSAMALSSDAVNNIVDKILPYVESGLQSGPTGNVEHQAGALMIVGLLSQKPKLPPVLVNSLIRSLLVVAREHSKDSSDLQLFRMPLMALINLIQLQDVVLIPRKSLDMLMGVRNIAEILGGLTEEFNIDKFLTVLLNSLLKDSSAYQTYHHSIMAIIETIPLKFYVDSLVSNLLKNCTRISRDMDQAKASESGSQTHEILVSLYKKYPIELREAIKKTLQDTKMQYRKEGDDELFLKTLYGDGDFSNGVPDSKIFFALEHPKADIRRLAVMGLDVVGIHRDEVTDSKVFDVIQDALVSRLLDDDMTVIRAALNLEHLNDIISPSLLLDTLQIVLDRCLFVLQSGASDNESIASDIAVSCLQRAIMGFRDTDKFTKKLAKMILPLVLILPKTQKLNLEALELVKKLKWPLFGNLVSLSGPVKKVSSEHVTSVNFENISKLAEAFWVHSDELMPWLLECSNVNQLSKTVVFLILLHSYIVLKPDFVKFSFIYDASFLLLQREQDMLEFAGRIIDAEESNLRTLDGDSSTFLKRLLNTSGGELNAEILICLCWRLLEGFIVIRPENGKRETWLCKLRSLFVFFGTQSRQVYKKHLHDLVLKYRTSIQQFLSEVFTEEGFPGHVQAECLHCFKHLCSLAEADKDLSIQVAIQLLNDFTSLLVPLASDNQDVRMAAMGCFEELSRLWSHVKLSRGQNGNSIKKIDFLGGLLDLTVQHKPFILSDPNVLPSIFKSLFCSTTENLLVQENIAKSFNQSTKHDILVYLLSSALGLSAFAKLKIFSLLKDLGNKVIEVDGVKQLLDKLQQRRQQCHIGHDKPTKKLSQIEIDTLCQLLEIRTMSTSSTDGDDFEDIVKQLEANGSTSEDPAVVEPCITILKHLNNSLYGCLNTKIQEILFLKLVLLLRNGNARIKNSAREALLQINISYLVFVKVLDSIVDPLHSLGVSILGKKKAKFINPQGDVYRDVLQSGETILSLLSSLLDVLILKKNMENRSFLIGPLFKLLHLIFMNNKWDWIWDETVNCFQASSAVSVSSTQVYIQQTLLLILEDICSLAVNNLSEKDDIVNKLDLELLVKCARLSSDSVTRNHVLSLFATIAKVMPDKVLKHILDILNIMGESAVAKWDSYSQRVFEEVISAVVPFCFSETSDGEELLQIFVNVLPQVPGHQKLSIVICLLRNLGESGSFGSFLFLLFHSLVSKGGPFSFADGEASVQLESVINKQWEYLFALELSEQYSCMIWLPSLLKLLKRVGKDSWNKEHYMQLTVAMQFVLDKLQNPEIYFKLESGEDAEAIQNTLGDLMEAVFHLLRRVNVKQKHLLVSPVIRKGLKELTRVVLKTIERSLVPVSYFKTMIQLLGYEDNYVREKALGFLCETAKEVGASSRGNQSWGPGKSFRNLWLQFDEDAKKSLNDLCLEILNLVDDTELDLGGAALKLTAFSTLESLVYRFPFDDSILVRCLKSVSKNIRSNNSAVSSGCLQTVSALIHALGPKALSELPGVMSNMFQLCHISSLMEEDINNDGDSSASSRILKDSSVISVLVTLEAVVDKLGGFLNPYLHDILKFLVLCPGYATTTDVKMKMRADLVRKLVTEKIPVRLLLPEFLRLYSDGKRYGGSHVCITFEMLEQMVNNMGRSSVTTYHVQIFDLGLEALDFRCRHSDSIEDVNVVEEKVINSIVCLTKKLTESMFKPLFVKSIEWSKSNEQSRSRMDESGGSKSIGRSLSFFGLVIKLVETHRSLFVQTFFKYLLGECVLHLSEDGQVGLTRKRKKSKFSGGIEKKETGNELSPGLWHLRALVTSSLQKCFLYDTGNPKFLVGNRESDISNFQVLLKPLVSQLVVDPPASLEQYPEVPSVEEVDNLLVGCIGQMAVTAGSDLHWKSLNHEVLMQTRSEKVRSRMLGLRIVKYLVENLKEEYLVLLAETIPFLGELLEDVELPIKTLAQEIVKEMELMSGESLIDKL